MNSFDLDQFEHQVDGLLAAYNQLLADYRALQTSYEVETQRNRETRERLNGVIERIRALEEVAGNT